MGTGERAGAKTQMTRASPAGKFSLLALSPMLSGRPGMPAPSQAEGEPPDISHSPGPGVMDAERAHLLRSREFLRLMREDVLSLRAMGGDPVSEEYLRAGLHRRAEALKDLPGTPLFFGRLDYAADA